MDTLQVIYNTFNNYVYSSERPSVIPNSDYKCDTALFTAWYLSEIFSLPSVMHPYCYTWTIYSNLVYIDSQIYEGVFSDVDTSLLLNGDVLIFSNNPSFDKPDPYNYWSGVYWDEERFLNFNEFEQFGSDSLTNYVNGDMNFKYVAIFRVRKETIPGQTPQSYLNDYPNVHLNDNTEYAVELHKDMK